MSHWWRAHDEAIDDPKLCLLSDRAHRAWFNLCCLTSASGGNLPAMKVVELKLRMSSAKVAAVLGELQGAGLIDEDEAGMRPHNWNRRQFKSDVSTERVQQFRERRRNVSSGVSETPPETDSRDRKSSSLRSDPISNPPFLKTSSEEIQQVKEELIEGNEQRSEKKWPSGCFLQFWAKYPHKVGKTAALRAFVAAQRTGVMFETLMFALDRYIVEKPADRSWCNPATWLNQGRWDDEPAMVTGGNGNGSSRQGGGFALNAVAFAQQQRSDSDHDDGEPALDLRSEH